MNTAVCYLCTFIGLSATAAYAVTFYLTKYNQLYLSGQSGYDETDLPYTYAIVECCISAATLLIGLLLPAQPTKRTLLICVLFFGVSGGLQGTFGMLRAWNLGLVGDDVQKTCSDVSQATGCPTTRFEYVHDRDIAYGSPSGGDCTFWFWGNRPADPSSSSDAMMRLVDIERQQCLDVGVQLEDCPSGREQPNLSPNGTFHDVNPRTIQTYMDWSDPFSYGWRDDPNAVLNLESTTNLETLNLDKTHNMQQIMSLQEKAVLPDGDKLTTAPSIAYCWYWGCNSVCHEQRYLVNRWWLLSSIALCVLHVVNVVVAANLYAKKKQKSVAVPTEDEEEDDMEMLAPARGRRKRQLVQNPSGLMF